MKIKLPVFLLSCVLCSMSAFAQEAKIRDARSNPDFYFLEIGDVPNSLHLLPPPPEVGSVVFLNDKAQYDWGKLMRRTARGEQAVRDAQLAGDAVPLNFSEAFGIKISKETTPEIYNLVLRMRGDAGDLATRHAKEHYMRVRPFSMYGESSCTPDQEEYLLKDGSYPSGHTAIGWATALVLAEINPSRQDEILKRGYEMGQSRVICGCHFQSDVDAGRIVASAVVARLHADTVFMKQLNKAKKEFNQLQKAGAVKNQSEK